MDILHDILRLAETIRDECGVYVAPTFHLHDGTTTLVTLTICVGIDDNGNHTFDRIEGEQSDLPTGRQTLVEMHEAMLAWLVEYRKGREAA